MSTVRNRLLNATRLGWRRVFDECRDVGHTYGDLTSAGGGITRRVCDVCGHVTIDLTDEGAAADPFD